MMRNHDMAYRREIDGIRAIAVAAIILFHFRTPGFVGGYVGVDAFFVVSGYLIGRNVLGEIAEDRFSWRRFIERRARRILPALYAMIATSFVVALIVLYPDDLTSMADSILASLLFIANIFFWQITHGYFGHNAEILPMLHLWSLGVEEQFYILFPIFLIIMVTLPSSARIRIVLLSIAASFSLCVLAGAIAPAAGFFLLPMRVWEFLFGLLVAMLERSHPDAGRHKIVGAWAGLAFVGGAIVGPSWGLLADQSWLRALLAVAGVSAILRYGEGDRGAGRLLGSPPIVMLGLISYSLYLWHQPVLVLWRLAAPNEPSAAVKLCLLLATLAAATASWRFIEMPFRDPRRISGRWCLILGGAAFVGLSGTALAITRAGGWPSRFPPEQRALIATWEHYRAATARCLPEPQQAELPAKPCTIGNAEAPTIAVFGDSHAAALAPAMWAVLAGTKAGAILFTHSGCPPILRRDLLPPILAACAHFNRAALDEILAHREIRTVIAAARWSFYLDRNVFDNGEGGVEQDAPLTPLSEREKGEWGRALAEPIQRLLAAGRRVVLVYPVPEAGWDVPRRMAKGLRYHLAEPSLSLARYRARSASASAALDAIGKEANLIRLYPSRHLCDERAGRCALVDNSRPLYVDDDHLSPIGARRALPITDLRPAVGFPPPSTDALP